MDGSKRNGSPCCGEQDVQGQFHLLLLHGQRRIQHETFCAGYRKRSLYIPFHRGCRARAGPEGVPPAHSQTVAYRLCFLIFFVGQCFNSTFAIVSVGFDRVQLTEF